MTISDSRFDERRDSGRSGQAEGHTDGFENGAKAFVVLYGTTKGC